MIQNIKLSVIMPLYNVEKTLRLALESILMQEHNFSYEIIAVDDASTDNTLGILKEYANKYTQIKILQHKTNQGNAIAFYNALCVSGGEYMCVLDGDDYYTIHNKLQKQIDFLDSDKDCKYIAVSHKYLRVNSDFEISEDNQLFSGEQEYDYLDFCGGKFYSHTSTYMYRNLFKNKVPEKFKESLYRGDNPRTFMHMIYSKGKIKNLNFVGSVYFYNGEGIWSQTSKQSQLERNISMLNELGSNFSSKIEKYLWNKLIEYRKLDLYRKSDDNKQTFFSSEYFFKKLLSLANKFAFRHQDFVFKQIYKSEFIDSFCESLGFIELVKRGYRPYKTVQTNAKNIMIAVSNLTTTGGGVYNEIKDIISMYKDSSVYILWTDVDSFENLDSEVKKQLSQFSNLTCVFGGEKATSEKLSVLCDKIISIAPSKIYHYCAHDNVYLCAMIQSMLSKNICVFSFDHGFVLGLDNTNYSTYITKRPMDYEILSKSYGNKVIYMPCWNSDRIGINKYKPFNAHKKLITACAAARYYKLSGGDIGYIDIVIGLLQKTGGKHIHYGPIPEAEVLKIRQRLKECGVDEKDFINIVWVDNLPESMYKEHVDVFIEPFPIVSYKITLDVLSAGIPIITKKSYLRMGITDFIYQNHLEWATKEDFINTLSRITEQDLIKHSRLSRKYYEQNHLPKVVLKSFVTETGYIQPEHIDFYDDRLVDVCSVERLLNIELEKKGIEHVTEKTPYVPNKKISRFKYFLKHLAFKQRYKEMFYGFFLIFSQIPILDLLMRSKTRQKILKKILKYYR